MEATGEFKVPPDIERSVRELLAERGGFSRLRHLPLARKVADHCEKLVAHDAAGRPAAFVVVSPRAHPQTVREADARARAARALLRDAVAHAVLVPWRVDDAEGLSYSVTEYALPLGGHDLLSRWRRRRAGRRSIAWLHHVAAQTIVDVPHADLSSRIVAPLERLVADRDLAAPVRAAGREALAALESGGWRPRHQLAHNDFWWNNLVRPASRSDVDWPYVIDWGGSAVRGFPVFDLLRMAQSLGLSGRTFAGELRRNAQAIGGTPAQASHHLLAALAELGDHLGQWPKSQYARVGAEWLDYLRAGIGSSGLAAQRDAAELPGARVSPE